MIHLWYSEKVHKPLNNEGGHAMSLDAIYCKIFVTRVNKWEQAVIHLRIISFQKLTVNHNL